jgi:hypothetical protein
MNNEDIYTRLNTMELEELYELLDLNCEERKSEIDFYTIKYDQYTLKPKDVVQFVKEGVIIKVPIQWITKEFYQIYPQNKRVRIRGYGKYPLNKFYEDIDERKKLLRMILRKIYEPDDEHVKRMSEHDEEEYAKNEIN